MATVSFNDLLDAAERQDWKFVTDNMENCHITPDRIEWARENNTSGQSSQIRAFAKMVLKEYERLQRAKARQPKGS